MPIRIITVRHEGKPSHLPHASRYVHAFHLTRPPRQRRDAAFPSSPALPGSIFLHPPIPPVASRPIARDAAFSRVTLHV